ncbi:hypothetical protein SPRA44_350190 [Serratia proteamaculans]|uniref:hypothetical protein n=1 Tax=Serratia proteamaculans TaxID=28151 RepID=UPI0009F7D0D3|nr:hypothetical protein SPRA44_350190 [Serratia proteamaculans]
MAAIIGSTRRWVDTHNAAGLAAVVLVPRFIEPSSEFIPAVVLNGNQTGSGQWIVGLDKKTRHLQLIPVNAPPIAVANSLQLWVTLPGENRFRWASWRHNG